MFLVRVNTTQNPKFTVKRRWHLRRHHLLFLVLFCLCVCWQVRTTTPVCCPGLCRLSLTALTVVCTVALTWSLNAVEISADWLQTSRQQKAAARRTWWGFSKRWDRESRHRYRHCVGLWWVLVWLLFAFTERQKRDVWKINFSWRSVFLFVQ